MTNVQWVCATVAALVVGLVAVGIVLITTVEQFCDGPGPYGRVQRCYFRLK